MLSMFNLTNMMSDINTHKYPACEKLLHYKSKTITMTLIGVWCDIITEQERNFKLSIRKPAFVERVYIYIYIIYSKRFMLY